MKPLDGALYPEHISETSGDDNFEPGVTMVTCLAGSGCFSLGYFSSVLSKIHAFTLL